MEKVDLEYTQVTFLRNIGTALYESSAKRVQAMSTFSYNGTRG